MTVQQITRTGERTLASIVAKKPPKYAIGQELVLKGYENGWRWTVTDATLRHSKKCGVYWRYVATAVRDYDAKLVVSGFPEWWLRPVPATVAEEP